MADDKTRPSWLDELATSLARPGLSAEECQAIFLQLLPHIERVARRQLAIYRTRDAATAETRVLEICEIIYFKLREGAYRPSCGTFIAWGSVVARNYLFSQFQAEQRQPGARDPAVIDGADAMQTTSASPYEIRELCEAASAQLRNEMTGFVSWYVAGKSLVHFPAVLWMELRRRVGANLGAAPASKAADAYLADFVPWLIEEGAWNVKSLWPSIDALWACLAPRFRDDPAIAQNEWIKLLQTVLDRTEPNASAASKRCDCRAWPQWICRGRRLVGEFADCREPSDELCILRALLSNAN